MGTSKRDRRVSFYTTAAVEDLIETSARCAGVTRSVLLHAVVARHVARDAARLRATKGDGGEGGRRRRGRVVKG